MAGFNSALLLLSLMISRAVSHAGFWFFRMGCDAVPTPSKNVGDTQPPMVMECPVDVVYPGYVNVKKRWLYSIHQYTHVQQCCKVM